MSYTKKFIDEMNNSEFQELYSKNEQKIVFERTRDKYRSKLIVAITKAAKHRGLSLNIFDEISVSGEEVFTGEIIIQIHKKND